MTVRLGLELTDEQLETLKRGLRLVMIHAQDPKDEASAERAFDILHSINMMFPPAVIDTEVVHER